MQTLDGPLSEGTPLLRASGVHGEPPDGRLSMAGGLCASVNVLIRESEHNTDERRHRAAVCCVVLCCVALRYLDVELLCVVLCCVVLRYLDVELLCVVLCCVALP